MTTRQKLVEFVDNILKEDVHEREVYGYISRYSEDSPYWYLFLVYDDSDGEKYCGGYHLLNGTDTDDFIDVFSMFSNLKKKIIVNTEGYFF